MSEISLHMAYVTKTPDEATGVFATEKLVMIGNGFICHCGFTLTQLPLHNVPFDDKVTENTGGQ